MGRLTFADDVPVASQSAEAVEGLELAQVVAIESVPTPPPSKRAERLIERQRAAGDAVNKALWEAGLLKNPYISPGAQDVHSFGAMHALRCDEWHANCHLESHLERRIKHLENRIMTILASDALTEDQRQELLSGVYGKTAAKRRDAMLNSEAESQLVDHYRAMDQRGRHMLRILCERLAASNNGADGVERAKGNRGYVSEGKMIQDGDIVAELRADGLYSIGRWQQVGVKGRIVPIEGHEGVYDLDEATRRLVELKSSGDVYLRDGDELKLMDL